MIKKYMNIRRIEKKLQLQIETYLLYKFKKKRETNYEVVESYQEIIEELNEKLVQKLKMPGAEFFKEKIKEIKWIQDNFQ